MKFQLHLSKLMQRANMKKVNCKSRTYFPSIFFVDQDDFVPFSCFDITFANVVFPNSSDE